MTTYTTTCDYCGAEIASNSTAMNHTVHIELSNGYLHKDICETCSKKLTQAGGISIVSDYIKDIIDNTELVEEETTKEADTKE